MSARPGDGSAAPGAGLSANPAVQRLWPYAVAVVLMLMAVALQFDQTAARWSLPNRDAARVLLLREFLTPIGSPALQVGVVLVFAGLGAALRRASLTQLGRTLFAAFLIAIVLATVVKLGVRRPRPIAMDQPRPSLMAQLKEGPWHSFPSGDVLVTMAMVVGGLCVARRPGGWCWLLVLPIVVGVGRVIAAKHFPSDVMGGLLLGIPAGLLAVAWTCPCMRHQHRPRIALPVAEPEPDA